MRFTREQRNVYEFRMIVYYFRTMSIFLGRMSIYLGKINQKLSTNFRKSHETVETLDTVVVSTNLENYAQSVSRVLKISCDQID